MPNPGRELTPEEWAQIEELRPKRPLTAPEIDRVREVLTWHEHMVEALEFKRKNREAWIKRFPIIFGAIGGLAGAVTLASTLFHWK